jgi:hypothetical protein
MDKKMLARATKMVPCATTIPERRVQMLPIYCYKLLSFYFTIGCVFGLLDDSEGADVLLEPLACVKVSPGHFVVPDDVGPNAMLGRLTPLGRSAPAMAFALAPEVTVLLERLCECFLKSTRWLSPDDFDLKLELVRVELGLSRHGTF